MSDWFGDIARAIVEEGSRSFGECIEEREEDGKIVLSYKADAIKAQKITDDTQFWP